MIKRILVPLDSSKYTESAIKYAIMIARKHKATITGMTIVDITAVNKGEVFVPVGKVYWEGLLEEAQIKNLKAQLRGVENKFEQMCIAENVNFDLDESKGIPSEWILEKAKFFDLVIMGMRTYFEVDNENSSGSTVKKILNHSVTPMLIVPEKYGEIKNALIAYDGSLQATRALQGFVHLTGILNFSVKVIFSSSDKQYARFLRRNLKDFFELYDIENFEFIHTEENIVVAIDEKYYKQNDLFVLGAHSKNAIKEFFIGSLTKYLIRQNDKPIFLGL